MERNQLLHKKSKAQRKWWGIVVFLSLTLMTVACRLLNLSSPLPEENIPVTTQAVEEFRADLQEAINEAQSSGQVSLTVSEAELTSFFALELQEQGSISLQDPQIFLREGQILIGGNLSQENTLLPVTLVLQVSLQNGLPIFDVVSATIGGVPLPEQLVTELSSQMSQILMQELQARLGDIEIQSIDIRDGNMTIQGQVR